MSRFTSSEATKACSRMRQRAVDLFNERAVKRRQEKGWVDLTLTQAPGYKNYLKLKKLKDKN